LTFGLDLDQQACVDALDGVVICLAGPGSGKTTVIVERFKNLRANHVSESDILNLTFTAAAAENMSERAGAEKVFRTFHSFVLELMQNERRHLPFELKPAILPHEFEDFELRKKLVQKYPLVRKEDALKEYISTQKREGQSPTAALAGASGTDSFFAQAYSDYERISRAEGWLDFDSLMVEGISLLENNPTILEKYQKRYLQVDEAQDCSVTDLRLIKLLSQKHGNLFMVGDDNQCQPAGSKVAVVQKCGTHWGPAIINQVPIEKVRIGDRVVSWNRRSGLLSKKRSRVIKIGSRSFQGDLINLKTAHGKTRVTPDHFVWATLSENHPKNYAIYLMWRKDFGFRVGKCRLAVYKNNRNGLGGFSSRCYEEKAEKAWILRACETDKEARIWEHIYSAKYGIPVCVFESQDHHVLDESDVKKIFSEVLESHGFDCLKSSGLSFEYPLWSETNRPHSRYFKIRAINVIPEIMSLPGERPARQSPVLSVNREKFSGLVYSLEVDPDHSYVADGVPVGNCIYEWRGAGTSLTASMPQIFPKAKIMYLGTNYRSTGAIVEYLKEIIPVDNGLASHMRTSNPYGTEPDFMRYADDYQEAANVLKRVTDHPRTAIIARTNRQLFRYQQACFSGNIKCKILGKKAFWEQNEVKQLLSLAKSAKMPPGYTAPMILKALVIQHRMLEKYKFSGNPLDSDPADNINSLYKMSAKFATIPEFLDFIRRLTYGSKSDRTQCLTLSTIHQMKGKEKDIVFLVGVAEGILPHSKASVEEERRAFFVGASRAAKELHITYYRNPSMFLNKYADKIVQFQPEVVNGIPVPKT